MSTLTIVIIAVIILVVILLLWNASNKKKSKEIESLKTDLDFQSNTSIRRLEKIRMLSDSNTNLKDNLKTYKEDVAKYSKALRNIEETIPNSLKAISSKGNTVNFYKVQRVDKKDLAKFKGYKEGDQVAYVTRKINGKIRNIPVNLKFNIVK